MRCNECAPNACTLTQEEEARSKSRTEAAFQRDESHLASEGSRTNLGRDDYASLQEAARAQVPAPHLAQN